MFRDFAVNCNTRRSNVPVSFLSPPGGCPQSKSAPPEKDTISDPETEFDCTAARRPLLAVLHPEMLARTSASVLK